MPDETEIEIERLRREVVDLQARLDQRDRRGMSFLDYRPLSEHPVRIDTAAPTDTPPNATLRIVEAGGARYIYAYTTSGGWESVAVT